LFPLFSVQNRGTKTGTKTKIWGTKTGTENKKAEQK
jgi:hypothetical protein